MQPQQLAAVTAAAGGRAHRHDPIACAACHREHHGPHHDLTFMTSAQCNHCHTRQFASFAEGHPEFQEWPYQRRTRIAFTHAAHQTRHFPEERVDFQCSTCHQAGNGEIVSSVTFERGCAQCHDHKIKQSFAEGVPIISLPLLDVELLADYGFPVDQWPEQARGDFDGALPPLVWLLLSADPAATSALERLGSDFEFGDVNPDDLNCMSTLR